MSGQLTLDSSGSQIEGRLFLFVAGELAWKRSLPVNIAAILHGIINGELESIVMTVAES